VEEQVQTPNNVRSKKPLIAVLAIVVLLGIAGYLLLARGPSADPAGYLPKEVALAATVDLTSSADKDAAVSVIRGIFKDAGVAKPEQELYKEINKELKLDFEKDVLSHLTGRGAFATLTEMNGMMPMMVAVIGAKSEGDAETLMKTFSEKLGENRIGFQKLSYKGCDYIRIQGETPSTGMPFGRPQVVNYVGAVKSAVVWANSDGGFKKVVDTAKGEPSLLKDPEFARLRQTDPATFATLFVSGPGYYKLVSPMMNMSMGMMSGEVPPELKEQMENVVAVVCTADANGEGLKFKAVGLTKKPRTQTESLPLDELAAEFPADAKIALGFKSFDKAWGEIKKSVLSNAAVKGQVSQMTAQAKQMMGFDPITDLLDHFTSLSAYYVPRKGANSSAFPGAVTVVIGTDKSDVVKASVNKLQAFAALSGKMKVSKASASGQEFSVLPISPNGDKLGNVVLGDKVIVAISGSDIVQAMSSAIAVVQGNGEKLTDSPGYKLVKSQLPDKSVGLIYGDIGGIMNVFADDIPEPDGKKVKAVFKRVGWFGAAGESQGTESTSVTFVPFEK